MSTIKSIGWGADLGAVYENLPYRGHSALHNTRIIYDFDADYGDVIVDDGSAADTGYFTIRSSVITPNQKPDIGVELNADHPLAQGLLGYWLMNENSGNRVLDRAKDRFNMVLTDGITWANNEHGSAIQLPGTTTNYGSCSAKDIGVTSFSIVANVNISAYSESCFGAQAGATIFNTRVASGNFSPTLLVSNNNARFVIDGASLARGAAGSTSIALNKWYQLTGTYEYTGLTGWGGLWNVYVNEKLDNATVNNWSLAGTFNSPWAFTGTDWRIGEAPLWANASPMKIGYLYIYDRVLSLNEIAWLYSEPYCMLEYPTRKHIFVPISAGNSFSAYWPIEINADSVISADVTDWPCLITDVHFPEEAWSFMNSDASDLRFTSDAEGLTELYFDLVRIDVANKSAHIYVRVPNLNSDSNTTIYAWVGNKNAVAKTAVWMQNTYPSDWAAFWPMEEGTGTTAADRTSNGNDGDIISGSWEDGGVTFDGSSTYIRVPHMFNNRTTYTLFIRVRHDSAFNDQDVWAENNHNTSQPLLLFRDESATDRYSVVSGAPKYFSTAAPDVNTPTTIAVTFDDALPQGREMRLYQDGGEDAISPIGYGMINVNTQYAYIGTNAYLDKMLEGAILHASVLSDAATPDEVAIHHLMLSAPVTFATAGEFDFQ